MLKIVRPICCGIDGHKKFIVATIVATDSKGVTNYKTKEFKTFNCDLNNAKAWLAINNCNEICMESTGKYWIPIFNVLEESCQTTWANPKYVKALSGKKMIKMIHVGFLIVQAKKTCSKFINCIKYCFIKCCF